VPSALFQDMVRPSLSWERGPLARFRSRRDTYTPRVLAHELMWRCTSLMHFTWSADKNQQLQRDRGISFEEIVAAIEADGLLDELVHPNQARYPQQRLLVVVLSGYAYIVPCVVQEDGYFLKTIYASRKATRDYLRKDNG